VVLAKRATKKKAHKREKRKSVAPKRWPSEAREEAGGGQRGVKAKPASGKPWRASEERRKSACVQREPYPNRLPSEARQIGQGQGEAKPKKSVRPINKARQTRSGWSSADECKVVTGWNEARKRSEATESNEWKYKERLERDRLLAREVKRAGY